MKNLLYLGIILMLASCGSNESENAAPNESKSITTNESEIVAPNESESAASNESKSADRAEEMCECLQDAGLDNSITISKLGDRRFQRDLERKVEKIVPKCLLRIVKEMEEEISD